MLSLWYVHFADTFAKDWIVIHDGFEARQNDIIRRRARMNIQMLQKSCCRNAKAELVGILILLEHIMKRLLTKMMN